jgi:hypothetical protein
MELGAVIGPYRGSDAALSVPRVALGRVCLGENEHPTARRERQGRAQSGNTAANDQEVEVSNVGIGVHAGPVIS